MITGSDIREARNRAGLSQEELAAAVGVTLRTVGNWERSNTAPRDRLPALRSVLGDYLKASEAQSPRLRIASDEELLAEVARRIRRTKQEAGDGNDRSAASMTTEDGYQILDDT